MNLNINDPLAANDATPADEVGLDQFRSSSRGFAATSVTAALVMGG
jgi:hypothetical protein